MEIPDIHLRVLFDFEYCTKDGKEVKIHEGEKLYLIKKTNEDWWQVIRSSGRPFYVPASYVEEISCTARSNNLKIDSKSNENLTSSKVNKLCYLEDSYRTRLCSLESQQTHESHKTQPVVLKNNISNVKNCCDPPKYSIIIKENNQKSSFQSENYIDSNNKANFVSSCADNIDRDEPGKNSDLNITSNVKVLPCKMKNRVDQAVIDDKFTNGYSHVVVKTCSLSPIRDLPLNLSNSLEELTQQIEQKAKSIGNMGIKSKITDCNIVEDPPVSSKNVPNNTVVSNYNEEQKSFDKDNYETSNLQYSGSFKTKHEREKWAKNYVLLSSMKEEEVAENQSSSINILSCEKNVCNDDINYVKVNSNKFCTNLITNRKGIRPASPTSDILNDESDTKSKYENNNSCRNSDLHCILNDNVDKDNYQGLQTTDSEKLFCSHNSLDSSTEDLEKNSISINSRFSPSDRGSTDSLLEVDSHLSIQESICTTASDSLLHTSDTSEEYPLNLLREEPLLEDIQRKKKSALKRSNRVESCRLRYPVRGISPPLPEENQRPSRELFNDWCEFTIADGRTFFYNSKTGEKSWKPPRRRCNTDDKSSSKHSGSTCNIYSGSSSPLAEIDENDNKNLIASEYPTITVPNGWRLETDTEKGCRCFINAITGAKWFSSNDDEGRVYYFEENSNESSWTLPSTTITASFNEKSKEQTLTANDRIYSNLPAITKSSSTATANESIVTKVNIGEHNNRSLKTQSMIITEKKNDEQTISFLSKNWPQLWDGHMYIIKEGILNRTKITENGKRLRKNWSSSYVALTELFLLFFKDVKSFAAMKTGGGRPEMCVDLNGALIDRGDKVSSRKNVYIISTVLGLQVLIQNDCTQQADLWLMAIQSAIKNLPSGFDSCPRLSRGPVKIDEMIVESESKKFYKVARSKSVKNKNKECSVEDLTVIPAERQTKIKARLKKFFHRRPTIESLVKKGIWKDESAFGCLLEQVAGNEVPKVPLFVQRCISCIEKSDENMKTDGLYRASGNLSQVQKIRCQVDQNNLSVIEEEDDVHVLTGALKLFFRELKEPLIPYHLFHKAIKASHNPNRKEKISHFREITKVLPVANYDTLKFLLQHLLRVTKYKEYNRMHIPNIAIVFGPTLMWPEQESNNMALDLMQQNLVIECLLVEYDNIFK